ncbi:hypothetical protein [Novosphingobium sp. 9]|uniref:hypothetical protein n=1 Tax=Novosphingobium sp. 9 TaxID=2025349 RepID=UPI0021B5A497|nr:hypothetical protein [Novosphingobium sp. 9]
MHLIDQLPEDIKQAFDAVSAVALLGALINMLPAISTLLTIVWMAIRVYETKTVQGWLRGEKEEGQ